MKNLGLTQGLNKMAIDQGMWLLWELDAKVIEGKNIDGFI